MGVGNADATPVHYLLVTEVNNLVGRALGLLLSSAAPTGLVAANTKRVPVALADTADMLRPAHAHTHNILHTHTLARRFNTGGGCQHIDRRKMVR